MYFLVLVKCPALNVHSTLRIKLIYPIHKRTLHELKISDACPWLYEMDQETIDLLENGEAARQDIIKIEINISKNLLIKTASF